MGDYVYFMNGKEVVATGIKQKNEIFRMLFRTKSARSAGEVNVSTLSLKIWHERLGQLHKQALCDLVKKESLRGVKIKNKNDFFCDACHLGKAHRLSFKLNNEKQARTKAGEFIHSDVCGSMSETSLGGAHFFFAFIDDASGYCHVYFLKHKSDVIDRFKDFERMVANKFGASIKVLRSGREYCNEKMTRYMSERGIKFELSALYTPEQNGKSERSNQTIVECARAVLEAKGLLKFLWTEAINTAVYLQNRVSISEKKEEKTSYEVWMGEKPDLSHVRVFGSEAFVHVPKQFTRKFDARSKKVLLVRYKDNSNNYRLYNPETKNVTVSRNVIFHETLQGPDPPINEDKTVTIPMWNEPSVDNNDEPVVDKKDAHGELAVDNEKIRDGDVVERQLPRVEPRQLRDRSTLRLPARYDEVNIAEFEVPANFKKAIDGKDSSKWTEAVRDKLKAHETNKTWTIVPKEIDKKTIDSKWVFKILWDANKNIQRYKARLCARGFQQRERIDYKETFSPVVRYDSLRVLLALIAQEDLELVQFDVQTAFLYGNLEEEIHMEIPEGLNSEDDSSNIANVVCRLNKSLYGLKQALRCWIRKFSNFLK